MLTDIKQALDASTEMATSLKSKSAKVMLYAKAGLIEREIHTLEKLGSNCYGCFVNHPSQKQHMADGGCLEDKVWQEVVANRFEKALLSVHEFERMAVANAVAKKLGEQGLFIEGYTDKTNEEVRFVFCL